MIESAFRLMKQTNAAVVGSTTWKEQYSCDGAWDVGAVNGVMISSAVLPHRSTNANTTVVYDSPRRGVLALSGCTLFSDPQQCLRDNEDEQ